MLITDGSPVDVALDIAEMRALINWHLHREGVSSTKGRTLDAETHNARAKDLERLISPPDVIIGG